MHAVSQGTAPGARPRENGDAAADGSGMSEMDRRQRELYAKQQQLLREQRSQDQEKLLSCISGADFLVTQPHHFRILLPLPFTLLLNCSI